ncbi:hypothetical protein EDB89DRAFT_1907434 [Lactarius sanguifluus]|nr:hypothetical protein EDB89DRAFT_1907434 [Lactarius sanguifluus]
MVRVVVDGHCPVIVVDGHWPVVLPIAVASPPRRLVAVAGVVVVAALVGCWATAGVHAARSCIGELEACCCSLSLPHMSCPKHDDDGHPNDYESTTQQAAAATTTTQRQWFNHTGNNSKTSSNNNAIDINGKRRHEGKLKRR